MVKDYVSENSDSNNVENLSIKDLIDIDFLQRFQDNFAKSVGMASIASDNTGAPITEPSCFTDFCMKFTRASELGNKKCMECDKKGGEESMSTGKPFINTCHAGLIDFAAPIFLEGKLMGNMLGGQVLTSPPDESKFRKIAEEIGVDPEEYIKALRKVKIVDKERIEAAAEVLYIIANTLSRMGYEQYKLKHMSEGISSSLSQVSSAMEELSASSVVVSENQHSLNNEIQNIEQISTTINEVLNSIKSIADQTKMLGLNAAIEAARVGDVGRGFNVVAKEIRKLSDSSKQTAMKITDLTSSIQNSVSKTIEMSKYTSSTTEKQTYSIEEINASVEEVLSMTEEMRKLAHQA